MTQRFRKALSIAASAAMLCSMLLYLPQDHLLGSWLVSAEEVSAEPEGEGTAESPYQISNADQLYWFAEHADTSAHAKLTDDIVVNENLVNSSGDLNSGSYRSWTPIGNLEATLVHSVAPLTETVIPLAACMMIQAGRTLDLSGNCRGAAQSRTLALWIPG